MCVLMVCWYCQWNLKLQRGNLNVKLTVAQGVKDHETPRKTTTNHVPPLALAALWQPTCQLECWHITKGLTCVHT